MEIERIESCLFSTPVIVLVPEILSILHLLSIMARLQRDNRSPANRTQLFQYKVKMRFKTQLINIQTFTSTSTVPDLD